jgi:predicted flap endonuclease-1-like 5' DNA nuclease
MAKIEEIEGIGESIGAKLRAAGVNTVEGLLAAGASAKGRKELEGKTGIDASRLLGWVNKADLCRIKGVSTQYSDLLEAAGVDTVKELRNRKADNLTAKMEEVNAAKNLVRRTPPLASVESWIAQAKELAPAVSH